MNRLIIVPIGGLCNRMRVIDSAYALFNNKNAEVEIIWIKNKWMGSGFSKLFEPIISSNIRIKEAASVYNVMFGKPIYQNLFLPFIFQKLLFQKVINQAEAPQLIKENYAFTELLDYRRSFLTTFHRFYENENKYSFLSPLSFLKEEVQKIASKFGDYTIGVHIRRADNTHSTARSPLSLFIEKMKNELRGNENTTFYLASDSLAVKEELIAEFGNRILCEMENAERDTEKGVQKALIELYALSETKKIIGSYSSSYSIAASELSDIPLDIITN
jgi:hypothetical protein